MFGNWRRRAEGRRQEGLRQVGKIKEIYFRSSSAPPRRPSRVPSNNPPGWGKKYRIPRSARLFFASSRMTIDFSVTTLPLPRFHAWPRDLRLFFFPRLCRCKVAVQVSIVQRARQSIYAAFQCLWDVERDNYSYHVSENDHVHAWCCVFGIYYD